MSKWNDLINEWHDIYQLHEVRDVDSLTRAIEDAERIIQALSSEIYAMGFRVPETRGEETPKPVVPTHVVIQCVVSSAQDACNDYPDKVVTHVVMLNADDMLIFMSDPVSPNRYAF